MKNMLASPLTFPDFASAQGVESSVAKKYNLPVTKACKAGVHNSACSSKTTVTID